jgi:gliding motility-associated protein GldL
MLAKANIDEELISNLGDGMRHLGEQAAKMGKAADVGAAAQNYSDSLEEATNQVKALSGTYTQVSESLNGLKDANEMGESVGVAMQQMSTNLGSLNEMYAGQLKQLEVNSQLYSSMGELVQNLSDSVEDTKAYKENIADLAKNLSSLNTVYANMLNAMGK